MTTLSGPVAFDTPASSSASDSPNDPEPEPGMSGFWRTCRRFFSFKSNIETGSLKRSSTHEDAQSAAMSLSERLLLDNIRALRNARVEDVQIPRADIISVTPDVGLIELKALAKDVGHSRFPIIGGSLDDVIGMIHVKDLFWDDLDPADFNVESYKRPVLFVAPSMPVLQLLQDMQLKRQQMALIVDEFGGIDGLVTIEDLIEEIVGDISDEHDTSKDPQIQHQTDGSWIADARLRIEDLEEEIGLVLNDDDRDEDVETLGGLITSLCSRLPSRGEVIEHEQGWRFQILEADPRRLKRVRIRKG